MAAKFDKIAWYVIGKNLRSEMVHVHSLLDVCHNARLRWRRQANPETEFLQNLVQKLDPLGGLCLLPVLKEIHDEDIVHRRSPQSCIGGHLTYGCFSHSAHQLRRNCSAQLSRPSVE